MQLDKHSCHGRNNPSGLRLVHHQVFDRDLGIESKDIDIAVRQNVLAPRQSPDPNRHQTVAAPKYPELFEPVTRSPSAK